LRQFFGFKKRPFSVTSDPSFLYLSQKHQEAIDALQYGIESRAGFIEITGDIGCGKTTLCRSLLNRLPDTIKSAYLFNSSMSEVQFLHTFMSDLGLDPTKKNRHQLFSSINKFLIDQLSTGGNVILIIDEAQNLSVRLLEQIRMLSNLETDTEKLLQIILVGQPELKDKLDDPKLKQLRQRIAIRYHIHPLLLNEITAYIAHRCRIAGYEDGQSLFDPDGAWCVS